MGCVYDDAEAFVSSSGDVEANEEEGEAKEAPPARQMAQDKEQGEYDGEDYVRDAGIDDEEYAGFVAVADGPADEVGMRLAAECGFYHVLNEGEGGRMSSVLQGVEDGGPVAV